MNDKRILLWQGKDEKISLPMGQDDRILVLEGEELSGERLGV